MAREMTQQERAAIQSFYYRLHAGVEGGEFQERYEQEDIGRIIELMKETSRAALMECAKVARNRADLYKPKLGLRLNMVNYHRSQEADDLADTLDRLAQEG